MAFLEKHNGKLGLDGLRMIHLLCCLWKAFFSALLSRGLANRGGDSSFPAVSHGFVSGRRREEAMLVQRAVSYKLAKADYEFVTELMDMSNAFASSEIAPS